MNFNAIFYPQSIAVIGASRTPNTVGNDLVKNLVEQKYSGKIYPVNPNTTELFQLPVYNAIESIPENIDLALIAVPAKFVPDVLSQAADKGAQGAIIISAGFKEVGRQDLEDEIQKISREKNIAVIGPNCLGVINPEITMNASFAGIMPEFGNIAFISQSGALCSSVLDYAAVFSLGFSKFMSIGNKACVDEISLLQYFAQDSQTKVIGMYVEQLGNAPEFIKVAKEVTQGENPKPIIILKSGRTDAGAAAIASHTGSLSGGDAAYETLFAQSGVIRANTIREFFEFLDIFSKNTVTQVKNVTIVTNAGGPGVLATDAVVSSGLQLAKLSNQTVEKLQSFLPAAASTHNPVDILGDGKADRYQQTLNVLAEDENTEAVMVLLTPQTMTEVEETAQALIEFRKKTQKPVIASFMGKKAVDHAIQVMEQGHVSTTAFPELAARGLASMEQFYNWSQSPKEKAFSLEQVDTDTARKIITTAKQLGKTHLPEAEASKVLAAYGFPLLKTDTVFSKEEAIQASKHFTTPVVLKIISPDILHKSDAGGVMLNIEPADIPAKFEELLERVHKNIPTATLEGALIAEMAPTGGMELILGANKHEGLGTLLMVGLGGIFVEVFKDVSLGYAPLTEEFAQHMVKKLKSYPILQGTRGQQAFDIEKMVEVLGRLSQLVIDVPEIKELDVNPLLVLPKGQGVRVLDARILL